MNCHKYNDKLLDFVLGETGRDDAAEIENHISACEACAGEVREIRRVITTLREADEIASHVGPDPQFKNRVFRKIPQRRRESVVIVHRHGRSKAPLVAALSAAALLLAVIVYVLAVQSQQIETETDSGRWARVTEKSTSGKPHLVDSKPQRPGLDTIQSQDSNSQPSKEADRKGIEAGEIDETEEPVGPAPAPSPELVAEEPQDFLPIPVAGEIPPDIDTETELKPMKKWIAQLYDIKGNVMLCKKGTDKWIRLSESDKIYEGDKIRTSSLGSGIVSLSAGGSVVLNRSSVLCFDSHTSYSLENGDVLTSSQRRPIFLKSGEMVARIKRSEAYVQRRKNKSTRIVATAGVIEIKAGRKTLSVPAGKGITIDTKGMAKDCDKIDIAKEIEWVAQAARKFKLWIEGESCRHFGYFVVQEKSRDISNSTSLHKACASARLSWGLKLPHTVPCYIWVRYARVDRDAEDIELIINGSEIEKKTISAASAKYFWLRAFKTTLSQRNDLKLSFTSNKCVRSRVDLILVTNDPDFKPSREVPKAGYYGKD